MRCLPPPEFANRMLDTLTETWAANHGGANLWVKSLGAVFRPLRQVGGVFPGDYRRLTEGLKDEIPDLRQRVDRIVTKQVFGLGITRLTSLLARRSVYCSKHANGPHSIAQGFATDDEKNILLEVRVAATKKLLFLPHTVRQMTRPIV
jgi:site-specific DNA-methyltransferase (adenine-specific)